MICVGSRLSPFEATGHLARFTQEIMREPGPLSPGFRELIAAYTSARNHCPFCLYSRHVDESTPGDRASDCNSSMAPVGAFTRPKGEHVIVHRCLGCGFERYCRIAADDDFDLVLSLPEVEARHEPSGRAPG